MEIAILGSGFSGLAVCWHLLQCRREKIKVTVFDPLDIGGGASGGSSGLLHPYGGLHARRNWIATEGMTSTRALLDIAALALESPVAEYSGILRPAITEGQLQDFSIAAAKYDDLELWDSKACEQAIPSLCAKAGLFIKSGITIDSKKYLQGLWKACVSAGASIEQKSIQSLDELRSFDAIVIAAGAGTIHLRELAHLPLFLIKGQIIELGWPAELSPLPFSLVSGCYIVMQPEKNSCIIGATYERKFSTPLPDSSTAVSELLPKAQLILPALASAPIIDCKSGLRVFSPDNLTPVIGQIKGRHPPAWVFTALGSKGLLYHARLAELCSEAIVHQNPSILPQQVRWRLE